jgi:microcystin-dependent protein
MIIKNGKRLDGCTDTLPVGTVQPFLGLTPPLGYLVCQGQLVSKVEYPELYNICKSTFGAETETHFYLPDLRGKTIAGYDSGDSTMNTIGKLLGQKTHTHTSAAHTHTVAAHTHTSAAHSHSTGNHTLTAGEIPSFSGEIGLHGGEGGTNMWKATGIFDASNFSWNGHYKNFANLPNLEGAHSLVSLRAAFGGGQPHNHGATGSTTPGNTGSTSLTSNSTTPDATGSNTNFQPTVTMNWIVKAAMLIPEYFKVDNTLNSTSTSNALSAAQGKILNEKFANYLPLTGTASKAQSDASGHVFENYYGRINDTITITFSSEADRNVTLPATSWGHVALPFNKTLTNTNTSLYSLNSSTGYITIKEAGYYLFSGTANTDTLMNWSLVLSCYSSVINDTMQNAGMINCWLSPVALFIEANTEVALMVRGGESNGVLHFRPDRSYFTITRIK